MKIIYLILLLVPSLSLNAQFGQQVPLGFAPDGQSLQLGDVDNDGDLDLVTANTHSIAWSENLGDGVMSATQLICWIEAEEVTEITLVDLSGDGENDLLYVIRTEGQLIWHEHIEDGNYGSAHEITIDELLVNRTVAGDFDNDGDNDVIVRVYGGINWYKNLGDGIFSEKIEILESLADNHELSVTDIDGDSDLDLVTGSVSNVSWFENVGGVFGDQQVINYVIGGISSIFAGDIDLDGDNDIIVGSDDGVKLSVHINVGDGTFEAPYSITLSLETVESVGAADIDGDGDLDVTAVSKEDHHIAWYENLGDAGFGPENLIGFSTYVQIVRIGDFDEDGYADIFTNSDVHGEVLLSKNLGGGIFEDLKSVVTHLDAPVSLFPSDMDNDGDIDILFGSNNDHKIGWFENTGSGTFKNGEEFPFDALNPAIIMAEDLDEDDLNDILVMSSNDDEIFWYKNLGEGNFGAQTTILEVENLYYFTLADLNLDGKKDIVASIPTAGDAEERIVWFESLGAGVFGIENLISTEVDGARDLTTSDLDNDGDLEVLSVSEWDDKLAFYDNLGDGTFGPQQLISEEVSGYHLYAQDIDGDGDNDVLAEIGGTEVSFVKFLNLGDGTFSDYTIVYGYYSDLPVEVADFNADGIFDVVVAEQLNWFEGTGGGDFSEKKVISDHEARKLFVSDLDGDGDLDIGAVNFFPERSISWHENYFMHPNQIKGEIYIDANENGIRDEFESPMDLIGINSSIDHVFAYTSADGKYFMNFNESDEGIITVFPDSLENWIITSDSSVYHLDLSEESVFDSISFGLNPSIWSYNLTSHLTGGFPRCNSVINYWISFKNQGTTTPAGTIHLMLDESIDYVSAEIEPDSIIGNNIYWNYDSLYYFAENKLKLQVQMPDFTEMGEIQTSILTVFADSLDEHIYQSVDTLSQTLVCAYDPNDKMATPAGSDSMGFISPLVDELEYTIRFQNTGNDTAITVIIRDQLDENLQWETFTPLASSHDYYIETNASGLVKFIFENIMLPDSNVNEIESHGFIKYKIGLKPDLAIGTSIRNSAKIYFDENPAVLTNTKINTIYTCQYITENTIVSGPICYGDSLSPEILFQPSEASYEWSYMDTTILSPNFHLIMDSAGIFELSLRITNEFCAFDTTYSFEVLPEVALTELDTTQICSGDSLLFANNYIYVSGEHIGILESTSGCDSILRIELIVNELPLVDFIELDDDTLCKGSGILFLSGIPESGTFYGPGVIGNQFNTDLAPLGLNTLYFTFEDDFECQSTDSIQLFIIDCLSLNDNFDLEISIHPNPLIEYTTITFGNTLNIDNKLIIYNVIGQEVYQIENIIGTEFILKKEELGSGVYLLTFTNNIEVYTAKLIVQ